MKSQDEVARNIIWTKLEAKVLILWSNNRVEYLSQKFQLHLAEQGIESRTSCANTLEENWSSQKEKQASCWVPWALLFGMNVSLVKQSCISYKPENFYLTVVLISPVVPVPHKVFGCVCFAHVPKHQRDKLVPQSYKCYMPGQRKKVVYCHGCVIFWESSSLFFSSEGDWQCT